MVTRIRFLLSLAVFICIAFSVPKTAEPREFTVVSGHPRLFITPSVLPVLKQRAATTHADTYAYLKDWCDTNWNNLALQRSKFGGDIKYETGLSRYALIYALGEISGFEYSQHTINEYGDKAVSIMLDRVNADDFGAMSFIAIAYDWVNSRMNTGQKQIVVNWFHAKCGDTPKLRDKLGYRFPAAPYSFYPGLAFYGDGINDSLAETYVDFIEVFFDECRAVSHAAGEDGGHPAGLGYAKYTYGPGYPLGQHFYALVTATSLDIDQTFDKYPYMNGFPTWLLYGIQPGPAAPSATTNDACTVTRFEDCGSWQWGVGKGDYVLMHALRIMAQVARDQNESTKAKWITWLINERFQAPKQNSTWDIIFNDRTTPAKSPGELGLPTSKAFGWNESDGAIDSYLNYPKAGLGQVYMKSSWDPAAATTHAAFKAFPYYYFGHQHFDSLAFAIFKGEWLALPNTGGYFYWYEGGKTDFFVGDKPDPLGGSVGFPHHWYYYERTQSTNSLLIMDPAERIYIRGSFYESDPVFKDGGQRSSLDSTPRWGDMDDQLRDWGGLIKHEDTSSYTYSSADATKGYNSVVNGVEYVNDFGRGEVSPKVSLVQRDLVYLKSDDGNGDYFVVFDRIDSTDPTFKKVFLLHTVGEPVLNGTQSRTYGGANGGLFESVDTDSVHIKQNTAQLFMRTLLPDDTKVYKMGGTGTATTSQFIDNTTGTEFQGPKIDISVSSTAEFPDKPIVTINDEEAFMCDGKTDTKLTGCIRGHRYFKYNHLYDSAKYIPSHNIGSSVRQYYAWMYREVDTGDWISHPYHYGNMHYNSSMLKDVDDYGRWTLRVETVTNETHTNFLHVLHPSVDMSKPSMSETALIEAGSMAGSLVKDSSNQWVVMFSKTEDLQNNLAYQASYSGDGKHLITGLEYAVYDIYRDGAKILTKQTSNQNTLYFESVGGSFQIAKSGEAPNDPPTASVVATPTSGDAPLIVEFSGSGTDGDGSVVSYSWSFGDGATSSQQNVSHNYNSAGNYAATLTVTDNRGATGSSSVNIAVSGTGGVNSPPTVSISANPTSGDAPLAVTFSGNGTDSDGSIVSYAWDFGDGQTSTVQNPFHTYDTGGSYTATLTVTDNGGATGSANVSIVVSETNNGANSPPAASIAANPTSGMSPLTVNFAGSGTDTDGSVVSYSWDFGDGSNSTEQNPTYTYNTAGSYTATLTVTDDGGGTGGAAVGIVVSGSGGTGNSPPSASVTANPMSGTPPLTVDFTGTGTDSDGTVGSYLWNFGDGTTSNQQNPSHTYNEAGYYVASLSVTDDAGAVGTASINIIASGSSDFPYVINDLTFYPIPDIPKPAKNVPYTDPTFHTTITRITDSPTDAHGSQYDYCQPGYPKHDIENADATKLIIQSYSSTTWHIWDANTHEKIKDIPAAILDSHDADVRWDNSDARILYTHNGSKLYQWNVETEGVTVVHDFAGDFPGLSITGIGMREEGDASDDRRYWAFLIRQHDPNHSPDYWWSHVVCYDKVTDSVVGVMSEESSDWPAAGWDSISMSPSGKYVIEGDGLHVYNRDFSGHVDLPGGQSHWDFAYDDEGREVIVDVQKYWYTPYTDLGYWYRMIDLETHEITWLAPRGGSGQHVSGNSHLKPGWILASLEYPFYPDAPDEWGDHSVYMVELTRRIAETIKPDLSNYSRVWRLAHAHSMRKRYSDSPYAKINRKGTKVWFGSGWGYSIDDGPYDTYQIDLPPTWYQDLMQNMPPAASISGAPVSGTPPLTVSFTASGTDIDGTIASYAWNFGDGSTSSQQNPNHTYNNPGNYTVTLTVTDDDGAIGQATLNISVTQSGTGNHRPTAYLTASPISGTAPLKVDFKGSGTDSDGTIASYAWNFGDGSASNQQNPSHTYNSAGTYTASLTVTDNQGATGVISIDISVASGGGGGPGTGNIPTASLAATPISGNAPLFVSFTGSGADNDGTIVSYIWAYGDGYAPFSSDNSSQSHTYNDVGDYIATVTVVDDSGAKASASVSIAVTGGGNTPPTINSASATPATGGLPLTVQFNSSATDGNGISYYYWTFGDGSSANSQNPSHTYNEPGNYIAVLTVKDGLGAKACASVNISVAEGGTQIPPPDAPTGLVIIGSP